MTNPTTNTVNARDLSSRLTQLQTQKTNDNTDKISTHSRRSRTSSSSFTKPTFSKSSTMSSTDTSRSTPCTKASREYAEVGVGEFSKPRINERSRRNTGGSGKSVRSEGASEEFRYYGRHGNQWLFNDFSVTDAVRKGWGKMRAGREDERDWFEKRN